MDGRSESKIIAIDAHRAGNRRAQGLSEAQQQVQDLVALLQTAISALYEIRLLLQRMLALSTLAAERHHTAAMRATIQYQLVSLTREVDMVSHGTEFNARRLLDGSFAADETLPVAFTIASASSASLGLSGGSVTVGSTREAQQAVSTLKSAIQTVSAQHAELGAVLSRLHELVTPPRGEHDPTGSPPITSRDMAFEATHLSRSQILHQPATALMAQARSLLGNLLRFPGR